MGRPAKPSVLKLLEGNRGHRPLNKREPQPDSAAPKCPDFLSRDAKAAWRKLVKILHPIGLCTTADGDALAMYAQAWGHWKAAELVISKKGSTYDLLDNSGKVRAVMQRPEVSISRAAVDVMTKLAREFGMTPGSRSRMMVLPQKSKELNQWEGLLANAN